MPEHERLLKLRDEARQNERKNQKKEFDQDFAAERQAESLVHSHPRGGPNEDMFLCNPAVGGDSSEEEEEEHRFEAEAKGTIYKIILL